MQASTASLHRFHRQELEQRGFTSLPAFFGADDCAAMRRILDRLHADAGSPALAGWGIGIHPLFPRAPELAEFLRHPTLVGILSEALGGPVRCVHSGARLSDGTSNRSIGYHHHHRNWPETGIRTRTRLERLLFGVYVDGTGPDMGPLVVLPRGMRDPLIPPSGDPTSAESAPGEVMLSHPPGTVSIFDTALWHTARRGASPGRRRLFGTHTQRCDETRPHEEDNGIAFDW
jgi:hypothetical protein